MRAKEQAQRQRPVRSNPRAGIKIETNGRDLPGPFRVQDRSAEGRIRRGDRQRSSAICTAFNAAPLSN